VTRDARHGRVQQTGITESPAGGPLAEIRNTSGLGAILHAGVARKPSPTEAVPFGAAFVVDGQSATCHPLITGLSMRFSIRAAGYLARYEGLQAPRARSWTSTRLLAVVALGAAVSRSARHAQQQPRRVGSWASRCHVGRGRRAARRLHAAQLARSRMDQRPTSLARRLDRQPRSACGRSRLDNVAGAQADGPVCGLALSDLRALRARGRLAARTTALENPAAVNRQSGSVVRGA
jgi:hypothetical protein